MRGKLRLRIAVLLGLLVVSAAPAVATLDPASDGYQWDGRRFTVPLTIRDNSGVDRHHWPVSTGVPLPYGVVAEPEELRVTDQRGDEVPCQFSVLSRYWARDRSLRWVLLEFQVDVPANGQIVVELHNDRPARPVAEPLTVREEGDLIRIETGPMTASIDRHSGRLLRSVNVGGREFLRAGETDGPFLRTGEVHRADHYWGPSWNTHGWRKMHQVEDVTLAEAAYRGAGDSRAEVVVERAGPLHTIVRIRGRHLPEGNGAGLIEQGVYLFTTRLHFFRGQTYIEVDHDIENADRHRPQWCYLFHEAGLQQQLALTGNLILTGGKVGSVSALALGQGEEGWLYQAGGVAAGKKNKQATPGGYRLGIGVRGEISAPAAIGDAARFLDLSDQEKGVAVAMRYLWEEAPRAISLSHRALVAYVQADAAGRRSSSGRPNYDLDIGERNIHDLLYYFHAGAAEAARAPQVCEAFEYPLFALAPTAWYADTEAWYFEIGRKSGKAHRGAQGNGHWQPERVGVRHHGWAHGYNAGGNHESLNSGWLSFLRSGALADLERNLVLSRWHIAHNPGLNYREDEIAFGEGRDRFRQVDRQLAQWDELTGFGPKDLFLWRERAINRVPEADPKSHEEPSGETYLNRYKWLPDHEHYALFRLFEYYYLTGSPRALDSINGFVNWDLNFQEHHLFRGNMRSIDEPSDFDREPELLRRGHYSRVYTWMLYTNLAGFHATGSPVMDQFSRWQIRRLLALLRHRHGQLTSWTVQPSRLVRLLPGPWGAKLAEHLDLSCLRERNDVETSTAQTWMEAQGALALHEAYKTYDDERVLDGLWGLADYFSHHVLYYPRLGMLNKFTSMPNSPLGHEAHRLKSLMPLRHDRHIQAFPYLYHYTGWPAVAERYRGIAAASRRGWVNSWFVQTGLWEQEVGAKGSVQPPERITDLQVTRVTHDGVTLAWTSPRDDDPTGRAARYFVKYSTRPIVQFAATDHPARAPEKQRLVRDVEQRLITAGGIGSDGQTRELQRGDVRPEYLHTPLWDPAWHRVDAFWMAEHVAGEPDPGPAGTKERFTLRELRPHNWFGAATQPQVKDLPRGTYYFAVSSWDNDCNLSDLSNVVEVTLP